MGDKKFGAAEGGKLHYLGQQSGVTLRNLCGGRGGVIWVGGGVW